MRFRLQKRIIVLLCLLLCFFTGAGLCMQENASFLPLNERFRALAGESSVTVRTAVTGNYILAAFGSDSVYAVCASDRELLAEGLLPLNVTLPKDTDVHISLTSEDSFVFEVMRGSRGRNAYSPNTLTQTSVDRTLTRAEDVHWFTFTAEADGEYIFTAERAVKNGLAAHLLAFDASGNEIGAVFSNIDSASALVTLKAGEACLIRICARENETGSYVLKTHQAPAPLPEGVFSELPAEITLKTGEWTRPETGIFQGGTIFSSTDERVVSVTASGVITAHGEGAAEIICRSFSGMQAKISITSERASVTSVCFTEKELVLSTGEMRYPAYQVLPLYAGNRNVQLVSSDPSIVSVNENGMLTAHAVGSCVITVTTEEGGFTDTLTVKVTTPAPVSRALIVGIASYEEGRDRTGCVNTTQGMADALSRSTDASSGYLTDMRLDLSKDELLEAIGQTFSGAAEQDTSLFYINCHGGVTGNVPWLEMQSGEKLTAQELERALRKIPGCVIVILDCCNSGSFIGLASEADVFASGIVDIFSAGEPGRNYFSSTKYRVLVSSSYDQNSYRMASSAPATEQNMSTVFARAFTEGIGWNLIKDKPATMKADIDNSRSVSLHEAWLYTLKRTMSYLSKSNARQTVQVWPRGDIFTILK